MQISDFFSGIFALLFAYFTGVHAYRIIRLQTRSDLPAWIRRLFHLANVVWLPTFIWLVLAETGLVAEPSSPRILSSAVFGLTFLLSSLLLRLLWIIRMRRWSLDPVTETKA